jgi:mRNA interferase MazF
MITKVKRGEVWLADLSGGIGSEQVGACRPVIVCSNDMGNKFSSIAQVIPITSSMSKKKLPTHVFLDAKKCGFDRDSIALVEQSRIVDQGRLFCKVAELDNEIMKEIEKALLISFGIDLPARQLQTAVCV